MFGTKKTTDFLSRLSSDEIKDCFREATELIDSDIKKVTFKIQRRFTDSRAKVDHYWEGKETDMV